MKERLTTVLNSLTAKYVAVFVLLVAVPAIGISWYLLDSSYNDNKAALIRAAAGEGRSACRQGRGYPGRDHAQRSEVGPSGRLATEKIDATCWTP